MAKYAIPTEVVFTFDDEPVDIQEMLHDNAESEEVVEGLERLLKAVAAPGFTEAEVVFDIGGGISVVRAARRTANPRKVVSNEEAAHLFGISTDALGDSAKVGQTVTIKTLYPNTPKTYTRKITKVTKRYLTVTDGTRYLRDTLAEDTSGSTWGIPGSEIVKIGGIRVDNPGDDGQQSLPLDGGRIGNPKPKMLSLRDGSDKQPLLPGTDVRRLKVPKGYSFNGLDLRGAIFDGMDLSGVPPKQMVFAWANLRGASFRGADLRNASFLNAEVDADTDFTGARVDGADFGGAVGAVLSAAQSAAVQRRPDGRTGNPRGGGLVSGYGINTFAMDPDDYAPERVSNPHEAVATMLGSPRQHFTEEQSLEQYSASRLRNMEHRLYEEARLLRNTDLGLSEQQREARLEANLRLLKAVEHALDTGRHYRIVRHYQKSGKTRMIKAAVTRQEAKEHCSNPNHNSETATSAAARAITQQHGPWYDTCEAW